MIYFMTCMIFMLEACFNVYCLCYYYLLRYISFIFTNNIYYVYIIFV